MTTRMIALAAVCLLAVTWVAPLRADWDPGDPYKMHWPQLPDLGPTGLDVFASWPYPGPVPTGKILADDWMCTSSGPVSDIHVWGSWNQDILPHDATGITDPRAVEFKLSIHTDIPAGTAGVPYSQPGAKLWESIFTPGDPSWTVRPYATGVLEQFYDPNLGQVIGTDTVVWQYNFFIDPALAFSQQAGTIYWLDVQALPLSPDAVWGWKTSLDHWNDDAVFGDNAAPFADPPGWRDMHYPPGHPFGGQSIDQAFVITPEPATMALLGLGGLGALLGRRRRR